MGSLIKKTIVFTCVAVLTACGGGGGGGSSPAPTPAPTPAPPTGDVINYSKLNVCWQGECNDILQGEILFEGSTAGGEV